MNLENSIIHPANMTDNPSSTRDSLAKYTNAAQIPKSSPQLDQPRKGGGADVFELFGV
jgi:1-phosphatidylinositol-3-phosphate 5-kinase